jgi:hypothetical protein
MRTRQRNLGSRRVCSSCGTKYYDLNKPEPACPRCGAPAGNDEDADPRATALARAKAGGPLALDDDDSAMGFDPVDDAEEDDDEMDELGDLGDLTEDDEEEDYD